MAFGYGSEWLSSLTFVTFLNIILSVLLWHGLPKDNFLKVAVERHIFRRDKTLEDFYASQPHIGYVDGQLFARFRAALRSIFNTSANVAHGYARYSKENLPFLVSNFRKGHVLVIPPASLKSVLNNPESVVAAFHPQSENVSAKWTMPEEALWPANHDVELVRKQITRRYGSITKELAEEVTLAFEQIWNVRRDWKDVKVWPMVEEVASRALNRVVVGVPLCRDQHFLERVLTHARAVLRDGVFIGLLPRLMKPILGPLIVWQGRKACEDSIAILLPVVEERLRQFRDSRYDGDSPPVGLSLRVCALLDCRVLIFSRTTYYNGLSRKARPILTRFK